jgi:hypothetical protein
MKIQKTRTALRMQAEAVPALFTCKSEKARKAGVEQWKCGNFVDRSGHCVLNSDEMS